jgi:hypothetical protein
METAQAVQTPAIDQTYYRRSNLGPLAGDARQRRKKRVVQGIEDSALDYGRPLAWGAEFDNEEPSDPTCRIALDGVMERQA